MICLCVCVCVSSVCAQTKMCENFPLTFLNFKLVKQQKIIFSIAVALNRCEESGEMPVGGSEVLTWDNGLNVGLVNNTTTLLHAPAVVKSQVLDAAYIVAFVM